MKSTVQSPGQDFPWDDVLNVEEAVQRLGDDMDLFREIVQIYLEDSPGMVDRMHEALQHSDANSLQRAAHSLKGLAATLSASEVVGAAARLEHTAASRNLSDAVKGLAEVDQRVSELNEAVQQFLRRK